MRWQNFKGDLTKFCEIFLNITLVIPQYSLKYFFSCRKLVKTTKVCNLFYFFIKSVVKWSENSVRFDFLWELLSGWAKFCEILSHSVRYGMYDHILLYRPF